jgi:hypothetical protein
LELYKKQAKMIWREVLDKIGNGEQAISSPFAKGAFIEYHYVVVDELNRRGFLLAWCPVSLKGIQFSSVTVPANMCFITLRSLEKKSRFLLILNGWTQLNEKVTLGQWGNVPKVYNLGSVQLGSCTTCYLQHF